jgi:hypothetical protein
VVDADAASSTGRTGIATTENRTAPRRPHRGRVGSDASETDTSVVRSPTGRSSARSRCARPIRRISGARRGTSRRRAGARTARHRDRDRRPRIGDRCATSRLASALDTIRLQANDRTFAGRFEPRRTGDTRGSPPAVAGPIADVPAPLELEIVADSAPHVELVFAGDRHDRRR